MLNPQPSTLNPKRSTQHCMQVAHLYKTFVFLKEKDPEFQKGHWWQPPPVEHRLFDPKDLLVLTDDCAP